MFSQNGNDRNFVTYRQITIPYFQGEIVGFALWYKSKVEAVKSILRFHEYLDAPNKNKFVKISFKEDSLFSHQLRIEINTVNLVYLTTIDDINSNYVEQLKKALREYQYFFIAAGFTSKNRNELLPLNPYNFISSQIEVDGVVITGIKKKKWPVEIFSPDIKTKTGIK